MSKDHDKATTAPAPLTQDRSHDGELKVGDTVTIEAQVLAITGEFLTLNVMRPAVLAGVARSPTDGTTTTLHTSQVRKV